ncbi:GlcG/HbpS family heme-binding protein [Rhodopila sp.]|uniref:GlcG/HbpS family heme-binding protein n=1 Tax=Rhodopila sp. TaxID=2480087 RepID=UPI003D096C11
MTQLTLGKAQTIITAALAFSRQKSFKPMAVAVLDARGVLKAFSAEDGTSLRRAEIAIGKAHGALSMGVGSRALAKQAQERPQFIAAVTHAVGGSLIPVPGGVLIRGDDNSIIGAVGASGDVSDNDEAAVLAGLAEAGLTADPG